MPQIPLERSRTTVERASGRHGRKRERLLVHDDDALVNSQRYPSRDGLHSSRCTAGYVGMVFGSVWVVVYLLAYPFYDAHMALSEVKADDSGTACSHWPRDRFLVSGSCGL